MPGYVGFIYNSGPTFLLLLTIFTKYLNQEKLVLSFALQAKKSLASDISHPAALELASGCEILQKSNKDIDRWSSLH